LSLKSHITRGSDCRRKSKRQRTTKVNENKKYNPKLNPH
jgi:hypothetical protein